MKRRMGSRDSEGSREPGGAVQAGYSLVELLAAVTITMFIMAGVYAMMIQNQNIYETQTRLADVQQAARVAIDLMTREVRMAGADPSKRAFAPAAACLNSTYRTPSNPNLPAAGDVAPLSVAEPLRIRVKMDRPTFVLGPDPQTTATPTPNPPPQINRNGTCTPHNQLDYLEDDENGLGDGFLNDEGEDVEYKWDQAKRKLYRLEYRTDPAAACRYSGAPVATASPVTVPLADNVVDFKLYYYDTDPPQSACPTVTSIVSDTDYEVKRHACDPSILGPTPSPGTTPGDFLAVRRVRVRLVVETDRPDPNRPKVAPKFGKQWVTLTSESMLRNR